jgi:hypothetical protein
MPKIFRRGRINGTRARGKSRYRCSLCQRVGVHSSMAPDSRSFLTIPAWLIGKLGGVRGGARCANETACTFRRRTIARKDRRRTSTMSFLTLSSRAHAREATA